VTRRIEPGATWMACDLHTHTPFDPTRSFGVDVRAAMQALRQEQPARLTQIAERFIDACAAAVNGEGLDLVAITDHNSIDGYRILRPYFEAILSQRNRTTPAILPGVEFSVGGERPIHFLVVFAKATPPT
jgi:predicted metal-dependent phosphoesterase TrpH